MNQLTHLRVHPTRTAPADGLKTLFPSVELGKVNLFVGPNGSGKTTNLLALLGLMTGFATVNTDTKRPFIGDIPKNTSVSVMVKTADGEVVVTRDVALSKGAAFNETTARVAKYIGKPPCSWNLADFATSTPGGRAAVLDAVAKAGGEIESWDLTRAQNEVADQLTASPHTVAEERMLIEAIPTAETGADWLKLAIDWMVSRQTETNLLKSQATSAYEQASKDRPELPTDGAEDQARVHALYRERADIDAARKDRAGRIAARTRHIEEGERLKATVQRIISEGQAAKIPEDRPSDVVDPELVARVTTAQDALSLPIPAPGIDLDTLLLVAGEGRKIRAELSAAKQSAADAHKAAREARQMAEASVTALRNDRDELQRRLAALPAMPPVEGEVCRSCGAADPLGRGEKAAQVETDRVTLQHGIVEVESQLLGLVDGRSKATEAEKEAHEAEHRAGSALSAQAARVQVAEEAILTARQQAAEHEPRIDRERRGVFARAEADVDREKARIARDITAWQKRETERLARVQAGRVAWKAADNALKDWQALPIPELPPETDDDTRYQAIDTELTAIDARQKGRAKVQVRIDAIEDTAIKAVQARETWEAAKALLQACRTARDTMASKAYGPIDRAARALVSGIAGLPTPFFRGPADFGAVNAKGYEVPYHALSESEQRITAACLVYALGVVSTQPCRLVLLDGLEVVQGSHRPLLLAALVRAAQTGLVDSVLLTMATDPEETVPTIEGLTIHDMGAIPVEKAKPAPIPSPAPIPAPSAPVVAVADNDDGFPF